MELSMVGFWQGFFSRSIIFIHMCATMLLVYRYFYKKKKKKKKACIVLNVLEILLMLTICNRCILLPFVSDSNWIVISPRDLISKGSLHLWGPKGRV